MPCTPYNSIFCGVQVREGGRQSEANVINNTVRAELLKGPTDSTMTAYDDNTFEQRQSEALRQARNRFGQLVNWKSYLDRARPDPFRDFSTVLNADNFQETYLGLCNETLLNVTNNNALPICSCVSDTLSK